MQHVRREKGNARLCLGSNPALPSTYILVYNAQKKKNRARQKRPPCNEMQYPIAPSFSPSTY